MRTLHQSIRAAFTLAILVLPSLGFADDFIPRRQSKPPGPPLSPADAIKKMTVPEGFHVEVVASEPDIKNPVAMTFDEKGRIWITESFEYPRFSAGKGRDRVKVLEDTTGDGKADKVTVFAEGLNIPSGLAVGHGGVWVANAPDILFLQDTDGDGKADKSQVVVTGFGRRDTHELPNSLTWGPDGYLYGLNGVFNHSHVRYPPGSPHLKDNPDGFPLTCALFRIDPRTWKFEVFAEGTSNPWGIAWDHEGAAFLSACVIDHLWHIAETGYYHRQGGPYPPFTWKLGSIVKHKHQLAAYCGIHYFDSDAYPPEYRDKLYMGNIHGNCINSDAIERKGSSYFGTPRPDFLSANDVWFMPVVQKTGPDGCLYVLDWYDRYHCYQDARRDPEGVDRGHGRLYRVRYKNTPRAKPFDLTKETNDQLIERLRSPNVLFRDLAQRVLTERLRDEDDEELRADLRAVVLGGEAKKKSRMHALWVLVGSQKLNADFHLTLLTHGDPSLRAWAVRAAGNIGGLSKEVVNAVWKRAADPHPDVLLQVAVAASKSNPVPAIPALISVLAHCEDDEVIPHIVWQNLHPLLEEHSKQYITLATARTYAKSPNISALMPRVLERMLAVQSLDTEAVGELIRRFIRGQDHQVAAARQCLRMLAERVGTGELSAKQIKALQAELTNTLGDVLLNHENKGLVTDCLLLATAWKDEQVQGQARKVLKSKQLATDDRKRVFDALVAARDEKLLGDLEDVLEQKLGGDDFAAHAMASLGKLETPRVADLVLKTYGKLPGDLQPKAIELLTQRPVWAKTLLASMGEKRIPTNVLNANQARRLIAIGDDSLTQSVKKHWGTVREGRDPEREKFIKAMREQLAQSKGNPYAGRKVFNKVCGQCHKMHGEGQEVGPDITRNGRSSYDQLLSNVFDPSLVIGADYRATLLATTGGRSLTGLLVEDSKQRVVLKIQGGKLETIPRDDIAVIKQSKTSMMPEGLEKLIKPQELADLFSYLVLDKPPEDKDAKLIPGAK